MLDPLIIAKAGELELGILPGLANRHGLITGATGTGKTVTLQKLAESFARIGVPVFVADVKSDLSGIGAPAKVSPKLEERLEALKLDAWEPKKSTAVFWDVFAEQGHPVRATISHMGPLLLARMLSLNEIQTGVLQLVFKIADDNGLLLLDLKDLRAMVQFVGENAKQFTTEYGNVSTASIGAIQRGLLTLEQQGGNLFFGEPMLDIEDLMKTDAQGHGVINVLAADKLYHSPTLYATFLLWLLSELFSKLPEVGDPEKPKLVFFFDEAHLLFTDAPASLLQKVEQVVRLIRSKGVGVYFVTQNPLDIPDTVLGQLGNRIQHALRAFTPRDQKAVKTAAETMRANPKFKTEEVISQLGVGEALVSFLDAKGTPTVVERAFICPPESRMGPLTADERNGAINNSPNYGKYEETVDRESAHELLKARAEGGVTLPNGNTAQTHTPAGQSAPSGEGGGFMDGAIGKILFGSTGPRGGQRDGIVQSAAKSMARSLSSSVGRSIARSILGGILGGKK